MYYGDILFRAIKVTKGSHLVEFYYEPLSFKVGAIISLFLICIIFVYIFLLRKIISKRTNQLLSVTRQN